MSYTGQRHFNDTGKVWTPVYGRSNKTFVACAATMFYSFFRIYKKGSFTSKERGTLPTQRQLYLFVRGRPGLDRMVVGFTTIYAIQSVHITTNVVSSNPSLARCTRYNFM